MKSPREWFETRKPASASAAACDQLLDAKVYTGRGLAEANWNALKAEALFQRGEAEPDATKILPPAP